MNLMSTQVAVVAATRTYAHSLTIAAPRPQTTTSGATLGPTTTTFTFYAAPTKPGEARKAGTFQGRASIGTSPGGTAAPGSWIHHVGVLNADRVLRDAAAPQKRDATAPRMRRRRASGTMRDQDPPFYRLQELRVA